VPPSRGAAHRVRRAAVCGAPRGCARCRADPWRWRVCRRWCVRCCRRWPLQGPAAAARRWRALLRCAGRGAAARARPAAAELSVAPGRVACACRQRARTLERPPAARGVSSSAAVLRCAPTRTRCGEPQACCVMHTRRCAHTPCPHHPLCCLAAYVCVCRHCMHTPPLPAAAARVGVEGSLLLGGKQWCMPRALHSRCTHLVCCFSYTSLACMA
jgi:hypothetical protein